jgi:succinyl-CoA synthetase beta subunit
MDILEAITEWEKGCCCAGAFPIECEQCTSALIKAIETKARRDSVMIKTMQTEITNGRKIIKNLNQRISHYERTVESVRLFAARSIEECGELDGALEALGNKCS